MSGLLSFLNLSIGYETEGSSIERKCKAFSESEIEQKLQQEAFVAKTQMFFQTENPEFEKVLLSISRGYLLRWDEVQAYHHSSL